MKRKEIVKAMIYSEGHRVRYTDKNGDTYTGFADIFETEYDNDEGEGASICVDRDDGRNIILYEDEIKEISIID